LAPRVAGDRARPIYHRIKDSIEAHLIIVFAALAVSRHIEHQSGWSIRKFIKTARGYRTVEIQAGPHAITAGSPLHDDLHQAIKAINTSQPAHQIEPTRVKPGKAVSQRAGGSAR
jgi:hypothetical protein